MGFFPPRHHRNVWFCMAPETPICVFVGGSFTVETQVDSLAGIRSWVPSLGMV